MSDTEFYFERNFASPKLIYEPPAISLRNRYAQLVIAIWLTYIGLLRLVSDGFCTD